MRSALLCAAALVFAGEAVRGQTVTAEVLNDRVNLRARPDVQSDVVTQVGTGTVLRVKSRAPAWVEVAPPDTAFLWIHRDMIAGDVVAVTKVNVRAGPGINHASVGTLTKGTRVVSRGTRGEWIQIAPFPEASLWISSEHVRVREPAAPVLVAATPPAPPPRPAATVEPAPLPGPGMTPAPARVAATPPSPPADLKLIPLEGQGREIRRTGEVRGPEFPLGEPAAHRLVPVGGGSSETLCHLRGNSVQLDALKGRTVTVTGHEYWIQGSRKPVVVVRAIDIQAAP